MHRALLVAHLVVAEIRVLLQRLADARHDAVAEDAEAAGEEGRLDAVTLDVLVLEELDERLRHGQANGRGFGMSVLISRIGLRCV